MFEVIKAGSEEHAAVAAALRQTTERTDYNQIAEQYNELKAGDIVHFPMAKSKLSNFKKQMENRGIVLDVDAVLSVRALDDPNEGESEEDYEARVEYHAFIHKITAKTAAILEVKAGRKAKTDEEKAETAAKKAEEKKAEDAKKAAGKGTLAKPAAGKKK